MLNLCTHLKISHLRLLDSLGRTGNLTRAAEKIRLSQPAASRLIHEMETIIGASLFNRGIKGMSPTDLGEVMIRHATQSLLELEKAQLEMNELLSGSLGTIRVGAVTAPAINNAMRAIQSFQKEHAQVKIILDVATSRPLIQALIDGHYDFVFARIPHDMVGEQFHAYRVHEEQAIFLVGANHPLLKKSDAITLFDTIDYPWVMEPEGSLLRDKVEAEFANAGLPLPKRILSTSSLIVNLAAISQGDAIAVVSGSILQLISNNGAFRKLIVADIERNFLVPPFYLIRYRGRALAPLAENLYNKMIGFC